MKICPIALLLLYHFSICFYYYFKLNCTIWKLMCLIVSKKLYVDRSMVSFKACTIFICHFCWYEISVKEFLVTESVIITLVFYWLASKCDKKFATHVTNTWIIEYLVTLSICKKIGVQRYLTKDGISGDIYVCIVWTLIRISVQAK